jgi:amino acid adenylation domain-containing protein
MDDRSKIDDRVAALSAQKRALLALLEDSEASTPPPIVAVGGGGPLSFGQEQLWFLDRLDPGAATYVVPLVFGLWGRVDVGVLRRAVGVVVARHEVLRSRFEVVGESVWQGVSGVEVEVGVVEVVSGEVALRLALEEVGRPFDLGCGPLMRVGLFGSGERWVLAVSLHHVVADAWSVGVLLGELSEAYGALVAGREVVLPVLAVQYGDFARWQRGVFEGGAGEVGLRYWEQRLRGLPALELPMDRPLPAVPSGRGDVVVGVLSEELAAGLRRVGRVHGVSLLAVLMTGFVVVLARYSGQDDVAVGTAVLGRSRPELEGLIGFFVNAVVVRSDVAGDPTLAELLGRVGEVVLEALDHQDVPFEKVVERVAPLRVAGRNPLFQVFLQLVAGGVVGRGLELAGVTVEPEVVDLGRSRFDLGVTVSEEVEGLGVSVEYATDVFDRWRVEGLVAHFERVLWALVDDVSVRVSQVELLSPGERAELVEAGCGRAVEVRARPLHVVVGERAAAVPDAVAVVFEGREMSYRELDRRAQQLAGLLRRRGVGPGEVVGVALERGPEVVVALLAVLKAGAAYTVLDLRHPSKRLAFILADSGARVVLTETTAVSRLAGTGDWEAVCVDRDGDRFGADAVQGWAEQATGDSLAYVLYTSGSTGQPKGVAVEHRAVLSYTAMFADMFPIGPGSRLLQYPALGFDWSHGEIFSALVAGATLVLVDADAALSPDALGALMRRQAVTYFGAPPALLAVMDPDPYPDLEYLLVGGEPVSGDVVNRWNRPGRRFVNSYGPTEAVVGCSAYRCDHRQWRGSPPIGGPLPNRRLYVVDRWGQLAPIGVPGELLIGGDEGLARGYYHDPELTGQRFLPDPFRDHGRVYRSGDLVRWNQDRQLEFLGRVDRQIKLRGLRIELEEIETVLAVHPDIGHAVVVVHDDPTGQHLAAYYTATTDVAPTDLRAHLADHLPAYMIPTTWTRLAQLPVTINGKIDRDQLPPPDPTHHARPHRHPRTPTETAVAAIFTAVLGHPDVSADDNFFELGGNSLQAIRVIHRIRDTLGATISVRHFYNTTTTITTIATLIDTKPPTTEPESLSWSPLVAIKDSGEHLPPLFCVHPASGSSYAYAGLARELTGELRVLGLEARGLETDLDPISDVAEMAGVYIEAMREETPDGPYALLGWSMGAFVAFEMARQLTARRIEVGALVLLDPSVPVGRQAVVESEILRSFAHDLAAIEGRPVPNLDRLDEVDDHHERVDALFDLLRGAGIVPSGVDSAGLRRRCAVFAANVRAMYSYAPDAPYPGRLTLIRASESADTSEGWRRLATVGDVRVVAGDHYSMFAAENVMSLARAVELSWRLW